jgi:Protein of unknown function (DUF2867)
VTGKRHDYQVIMTWTGNLGERCRGVSDRLCKWSGWQLLAVLAAHGLASSRSEAGNSPPTQSQRPKPAMRLPSAAHTSLPWRIHELTRDFRLEDVWAVPTPGGREDFARLVRLIAAGNPSEDSSVARMVWAIRWKIGKLFGWDRPETGVGRRVPTLRERLPVDLREAASGPDFDALPFRSLYLLDDEWAAEIANQTVHGVLHLGWVSDGAGGYRGQMAVLVKPNGLLGTVYLEAIRPFRHLLIYPSMMQAIARDWRAQKWL